MNEFNAIFALHFRNALLMIDTIAIPLSLLSRIKLFIEIFQLRVQFPIDFDKVALALKH